MFFFPSRIRDLFAGNIIEIKYKLAESEDETINVILKRTIMLLLYLLSMLPDIICIYCSLVQPLFSYLAPTNIQRNPLDNTLRFGFTFDLGVIGSGANDF